MAANFLVIKIGNGTEFGGGDVTSNEYPAYKPSAFSVEGEVELISTVFVSIVTSFWTDSVGGCRSGVF